MTSLFEFTTRCTRVSQLYTVPWIDALRATIPGKLVLGNTFNWGDLAAYALRIALGAWAEWKWRG